MNLLIIALLWNWVAIPYFVFLIIQLLFPMIPSTWTTFAYIILLLSLIRGNLNLVINLKVTKNDV